MTRPDVRQAGGVVRFKVHVQPRASRAGIAGVHGDALKVRITAPPVDGRANAAVEALLAEALGVARHAVHIIAGAGTRDKVVEVTGVTVEDIRRLVARS